MADSMVDAIEERAEQDKMDMAEVAEEYKLPKSTVGYLVRTRQIPHSRLGKRAVRFSRQELVTWWKQRSYAPANYKKK